MLKLYFKLAIKLKFLIRNNEVCGNYQLQTRVLHRIEKQRNLG